MPKSGQRKAETRIQELNPDLRRWQGTSQDVHQQDAGPEVELGFELGTSTCKYWCYMQDLSYYNTSLPSGILYAESFAVSSHIVSWEQKHELLYWDTQGTSRKSHKLVLTGFSRGPLPSRNAGWQRCSTVHVQHSRGGRRKEYCKPVHRRRATGQEREIQHQKQNKSK